MYVSIKIKVKLFIYIYHFTPKKSIVFNLITYHEAFIGSKSVTTRNMYSMHVINLNNKLAIRIRKPVKRMK